MARQPCGKLALRLFVNQTSWLEPARTCSRQQKRLPWGDKDAEVTRMPGARRGDPLEFGTWSVQRPMTIGPLAARRFSGGFSACQAALLVLLARSAGARIVAANLGAGANVRGDVSMAMVAVAIVVVVAATACVVVSVVVDLAAGPGRFACAGLRLDAHQIGPRQTWSTAI